MNEERNTKEKVRKDKRESMGTTSEKRMVEALKHIRKNKTKEWGIHTYRWSACLYVRETKLREMRSKQGTNQRYLLDVMCNIMVDIKMK